MKNGTLNHKHKCNHEHSSRVAAQAVCLCWEKNGKAAFRAWLIIIIDMYIIWKWSFFIILIIFLSLIAIYSSIKM